MRKQLPPLEERIKEAEAEPLQLSTFFQVMIVVFLLAFILSQCGKTPALN